MKRTLQGLIDAIAFPTKLRAHVVQPKREHDEEVRIQGYAVASDLAPQADPLAIAWLSLKSTWPNRVQREALGWALSLLAPLDVSKGPTHAAVLAKVCGGAAENLPAIDVLAL